VKFIKEFSFESSIFSKLLLIYTYTKTSLK